MAIYAPGWYGFGSRNTSQGREPYLSFRVNAKLAEIGTAIVGSQVLPFATLTTEFLPRRIEYDGFFASVCALKVKVASN